jgi:hypothetical protein
MMGKNFLDYIPLHLNAVDPSPDLKSWILTWGRDQKMSKGEYLSPERWFEKHDPHGCYIWCPAPAAAKQSVAQLGLSNLKRPTLLHIVIIPRLMTALWRKVLGKIADVILTLPTGNALWPCDEHEPLILCIAFPSSRSFPWGLRGSTIAVEIETLLQEMWKDDPTIAGDFLRKCVKQAWELS